MLGVEEAVHLTFNNAMLYNVRGSDVHECAKKLLVRYIPMVHAYGTYPWRMPAVHGCGACLW